jgi:hypothetical protein
MAAKTQTLNQGILNYWLRNLAIAPAQAITVYVALNTTASSPTVPGAEDADANYARMAVTFAAPVGSSVANVGTISFYGAGRAAGSATIVEAAIYDDPLAGNELYYGAISPSKVVGTGDTASFIGSALTVTES